MNNQHAETNKNSPRIPWITATVLAILALIGGIWLGRTAFVEPREPETNFIEPALVDDGFTGTVRLEYLEAPGILVLHLRDLPKLPETSVYQVWLIHGSNPVSMGVLPSWKSKWAISGDVYDAQTVMITVEPAPTGSELPTTEPSVRFDLDDFEKN